MTHYLKEYAYFTNKFEMDRAASQHQAKHKEELTPSDFAVLQVIRQYSVKYGAAHLKHDTLAGLIKKVECHSKAVYSQINCAWDY